MADLQDQLKCGKCGNPKFHLHHISSDETATFGGEGAHIGMVSVTCTSCHDVTHLVPGICSFSTPSGHLCGGWKTKKRRKAG